jgi:beta-glucosidase
VNVAFTVSNTGSREGTEVVQLYLRHDAASVTRPVRELRRFQRVPLRAGESRTVRFTLRAEDMDFLDLDLRRVVEPGTMTLFAGGSSAATLEAHLTLDGPTRVLAPAPPRMH